MAKPSIEERLARLEGAYEQIDRRLESIERKIADLREEIRGLRAYIDTKIDSVDRKIDDLRRMLIYMAIGFITAFAGIIATILLIALKP